jgi:hypothetical protein
LDEWRWRMAGQPPSILGKLPPLIVWDKRSAS